MDVGLLTIGQNHLDHVETPRNLTSTQQTQPLVCASLDQAMLFTVHRIQRPTLPPFTACLHLGKKQQITLSRDDIDFPSSWSFEVEIQDLRPIRTQPRLCDPLPERAQRRRAKLPAISRRQTASRVEQPAETTDDECDRAHGDGALQDALSYHSPYVAGSRIREIPPRR